MPEEWRHPACAPRKAISHSLITGMESACWMLVGRYLTRPCKANCSMLLKKFYSTRNVASEQVRDMQT